MSVWANNYGEIILLTDEIENNIYKFKTSIEHFFSSLIEHHNCIYDISFDIDGESILKYSFSESTQDEFIKFINDKFSYLLNNDEILLEIVKKLENKTIKFRVDYNLGGFEFLNLLATLYDYCNTFEVKAEKEAEHEYFSILKCKDGEIDYCYSGNTDKMSEGYIEEIEVYSTNGNLSFDKIDAMIFLENNTYDLDPIKEKNLKDKIEKAKELLNSLDIDNFGYDCDTDSDRETVLDLNSFTLDKHNKKKFISTIMEIAKMFDLEKEQFNTSLYFWGGGEYYLESYVIEDGELKVKHIKY